MASKRKTRAGNSGYILGREAFAYISAVEGLVVNRGMEETFRKFDRDDLSPDERRRELIRIYGRKS